MQYIYTYIYGSWHSTPQLKLVRHALHTTTHCRLCVVDDEHFGFFIDAVDSQKFGIPTTSSQAKCLAKMPRIKQKLTGVQLFQDNGIFLFRTLPDTKTGGNLTLTIICHLLENYVSGSNTTDVYINFDGASDNICYTVIYGLHWHS